MQLPTVIDCKAGEISDLSGLDKGKRLSTLKGIKRESPALTKHMNFDITMLNSREEWTVTINRTNLTYHHTKSKTMHHPIMNCVQNQKIDMQQVL